MTTADNKPKTTTVKKAGALAALIGLASAGLTTAIVERWESGGKNPPLVAYQDIVGVWTICDGETLGVKKGDRDTLEGCKLRLDKRLANDFGPAVLKCIPVLKGRDPQLAATISLSYNIGTAAICNSTVKRRFMAGDFKGACDAFLMWNKAGGRVVQGLVNRRQDERKLCLRGL